MDKNDLLKMLDLEGKVVPVDQGGWSTFNTALDGMTINNPGSNFALRGAILNGAVEFAGFRFDRPWLELNPVFTIANIGSGALRDFTVTFDQHSKIVRFTSATKLHRLTKSGNVLGSSPFEE